MSGNALEKPNVEQIMRGIRTRVKERASAQGPGELFGSTVSAFTAKAGELSQGESSPVQFAEELQYLNQHWLDWQASAEISSHRKFIGRLICRAKRFVVDTVYANILQGYFERERQYQMNLVRFLNSTARYIDERDASIFWQLIRKIDHELAETNRRIDEAAKEADATLRTVELELSRRVSQQETEDERIRAKMGQIEERASQLDDVLRGLERMISLFSPQPLPSNVAPDGSANQSHVRAQYLLLENRFRGSEEVIRERQRDYLDYFKGASLPVLDMGSGRGELLELFREAGIAAFGIDMDDAMVARCAQKGLDARLGDAIAYLRAADDRSLGGLIACQVVEHLNNSQLEELMTLCAVKVKSGGRVIFETINPQSVIALSRNFFRDPTHVWPLHPDTLRFIMEMRGLKTVDVVYRAEYPSEATLKPVEMSPYLPSRWKSTLDQLNENVERLNSLLFGYQDYCIVAEAL
jgi:SAM-dependent methyltransferase